MTGQVITDGINISTVDLQRSRRTMSVITQNPVLFTSSLRMNLDPFEEHDNRDLWNALEKANLKNMVEMLPRQLHKEICECGANFSVSERQLLCLARTSLKKNNKIVMDEATANVDWKTDQVIQETIRKTLYRDNNCTSIEHYNTCDRVLVLENGQVVEYDKPGNLLHNDCSQFSRLYHGLESRL